MQKFARYNENQIETVDRLVYHTTTEETELKKSITECGGSFLVCSALNSQIEPFMIKQILDQYRADGFFIKYINYCKISESH